MCGFFEECLNEAIRLRNLGLENSDVRFTEPSFLGYLLSQQRFLEPILQVGVGRDLDFHRMPFVAHGYTAFLTQDVRSYEGSPAPDYVCDVCQLSPISDSSIGTLCCFNVLEHCYAPWRAVAEIQRVLQKGGTLVGSVPLRTAIHRHNRDYWRFCPDGIAELLRGLRLEQFVIEGNPELPANLLFAAKKDSSRSEWDSNNQNVVSQPFVITKTDYLTESSLKKAVVNLVRSFGYDLGLWTKHENRERMQSLGYSKWTLVPHGTDWPK